MPVELRVLSSVRAEVEWAEGIAAISRDEAQPMATIHIPDNGQSYLLANTTMTLLQGNSNRGMELKLSNKYLPPAPGHTAGERIIQLEGEIAGFPQAQAGVSMCRAEISTGIIYL